ncbi:MAG: hypothetical protein GTO17_01270 [Candidatus Aminicenantes bacterium]|nr:hypothetical protein [Candidatus Aminicenantes bacterium]
MEESKKEKEKMMAPISSSRALQIAMKDSETSRFIVSNFSYPEQGPKIVSHRWISRDWRGYRWNIEIIEKHKFTMGKTREMLNIARIEIDSEGRITRRRFLRNILENEYEKYLGKKGALR